MDLITLSHERITAVSWVAFDTEATGYSNVSDRLVEIAGVRFHREAGEWISDGEFCELTNPGRAIPEDAIAVHGISNREVCQAAPPLEVVGRFFEFAAGAVLMAHYAPFDVGAIAFGLAREGREIPAFFVLDTFPLPRKLFPGLANYSLGTLVDELELPGRMRHRALPDAQATRGLFERCVEKIGDPDELLVGSVLEHCGRPLTFEEFSRLPYRLPASLACVEEAIAQGRDLTLEYRGGSRGLSPRRVTPTHLFAREGHVFLEAVCHLDTTRKSFRIDRIEKATLVELP